MTLAAVFGFHAPLAEIVYRSAIVYVAVVGLMLLSGRRQLGQMTPFDLVLILLIANAVQNAMVGTDSTILGGVVAAAALIVTSQVFSRVAVRFGWFRRVVEGEPKLLIHDGQLVERNLHNTGVTQDLLLQACREHGFDTFAEVKSAVLEIDGTISIVPRNVPAVRTRHRVRATQPGGN
jgi:uncharacterized membrane protein YcaP (DUF421 family)